MSLALPPLDYDASAITGYTRVHWQAVATHLLLSLRRHASPGCSLLTPPGAPGGFGTRIDGLEGFARSFVAAAALVREGDDPHDFAGFYARGIAAGTDPTHPERWVRPDEHNQAKVEAASIALGLLIARDTVWERLSPAARERTVDYLSLVLGAWFPDNNWVWFRVLVQQFLRSVGAPFSRADLEHDLALADTFVRADGWYADGPERSYDHYCGWVLHAFPALWLHLAPADDEFAAPRRADYDARLMRYLDDAFSLLGADGPHAAPLVQGRSLTYRFASAAPLWAGGLRGVADPGAVRRAASGILRHFVERDGFGESGLLALGYYGEQRAVAQSYSGTGSPYWASHGLLGLLLPADHPVWTAPELPLPVERADVSRVVTAPGWLVAGTRADGIVRVINHGTDHAQPGDDRADDPLYARLAYSGVTAPGLAAAALTAENTACVVGPDVAASQRTGFTALAAHESDGVLIGASHCRALAVVSLVRGATEVRCLRAIAPVPAGARLRLTGWALPSNAVGAGGSRATTATLASSVSPHGEFSDAGVARTSAPTVFGVGAAVPWVEWQVAPPANPAPAHGGGPANPWHAASVILAGRTAEPDPARVQVDADLVRVTWPDGHTSTHDLGALATPTK